MASRNSVAEALAQLEADLAPVVLAYLRRRLLRTGWTPVNLACLTRPWRGASPMVLARVLGTAVELALPDDPGRDWDPAIRRDPATVIAWAHALLTMPDAGASNFAHSMPPDQRWSDHVDAYSAAVSGDPDLAVLAARAGLSPHEAAARHTQGTIDRAALHMLAALRCHAGGEHLYAARLNCPAACVDRRPEQHRAALP